jgi:hypothetical protein
MRNSRTSLTVFLAALYVLLGVSASWHAPHFSRGETAVHVDDHGGGHETPESEDCALCSWKVLSHESGSVAKFALLPRTVATAERSDRQIPVGGLLRLAQARAPPFLS